MKFDLVISDFDGTLGKAPDLIESETVSAIKEYTDKGGIFAVCSGRMYRSIRAICLKYGFSGAVVSYQGAMINDIKTGKSIFSGGVDPSLAAEIVKDFKERKIPVIVDINDEMLYEERTDLIAKYEYGVGVKGIKIKDAVETAANSNEKINKVIGVCEPITAKKLEIELSEKYKGRLLVNTGAPILVEAIDKDCGKGFAVEFLAKHYGVPYEKIMAVGDSSNDIGLLNGKWHGVAVGSACEELKAVADEVTVPFSEQPIKYLLRKYCL